MSLTSQLHSPLLRDRFRSIAPERGLFYVDPLSADPGVPAFDQTELLVPADTFGGEAGRVGTAFDYLFRAQLARWAQESPTASMQWTATRGLGMLSVPIEEILSYAIEERPWLHRDCLDTAHRLRDSNISAQIQLAYDAACHVWERFVAGADTADDVLIDSVWLLAGLEACCRAAGAHDIPPQVVAALPDKASRTSLSRLWSVLRDRKALFSGASRRCYNPEFGAASKLVGGADADIVLDDSLIDIKTTANRGYQWTTAAQLATYVAFAAMCGAPWPLRRAGIYQARYGRLLWFDVADLVAKKDLRLFAANLTGATSGARSRPVRHLMENLERSLSEVPDPQDKPVPVKLAPMPRGDQRAVRHATEMAWTLAILQRHADFDFTVQELFKWQDEPSLFDKYSIAMALEELGRQGLAIKRFVGRSKVPYWTVPQAGLGATPESCPRG